MDLFISLAIILSHILLLHYLRKAAKRNLKNGFLEKVVVEALCAYEQGCVAQEQGVILENYGLAAWAICLACFVMWILLGWEGVSPNPVPYLLEIVTGNKSIKNIGKCLIQILVPLLAMITTRSHMSMVWETGTSNLHSGRAFRICTFPFSSFHVYQLVLVELIGTLVLTILLRLIAENEKLANNDPTFFYRAGIMASTVVTVVIAAIDITGGMYNPTLATTLLGKCLGHNPLDHLAIYWAGPAVGTWAGEKIYPIVAQEGSKGKEEKEVKKDK